MIDYLVRYHTKLQTAFIEHLVIVGIVLALSIIISFLITFLIMGRKKIAAFVLRIFGAVYAIPSLALFAILIPFLGIGAPTAITVLVLYNQFLLIRNFLAGFNSIDPVIIEAANAMGMSKAQVVFRIRFPLAFPAIIAGIHLAVLSTIGIGTIAAVINSGGIGTILFDGLRTFNTVKILWGTILAAILAVSANIGLNYAEKKAKKMLHF